MGKLNEYLRVLKVTKKPSKSEHMTIVKITGIGILIIGLLGFTITLIKQVVF